MNLIELAKLARDELVAMAKDGKVKGPNIWAAFRGGAEYLAAVATGDVASATTQRERASMCRGCKHATARVVMPDRIAKIAHYCGQPVWSRDDFDAQDGTCGCLIGVSVDGQPLQHAAGKAVVASESCPLGKW